MTCIARKRHILDDLPRVPHVSFLTVIWQQTAP